MTLVEKVWHRKCLVGRGISRSATLVIAALMHRQKLAYSDAPAASASAIQVRWILRVGERPRGDLDDEVSTRSRWSRAGLICSPTPESENERESDAPGRERERERETGTLSLSRE